MNLAQRAFDVHGDRYDRVIGQLFAPLYRRLVADTVADAPPGGVVLDAGAGPGRVAVMLATRRPDLTVYAVDLAPGGTIRIYDARFAPWGRLDRAVGRAVPRTRSGLVWARASYRR